MEQRTLGRTGLKVSALGYGCGAVGGLMVGGRPADQERAVARALEAGITYFDTAASYGDGRSETNLGRVLAKLKPNIVVGTKVRIPQADYGRIGAAVTQSLEASLQRLGRDHVDLFQLHNLIGARDDDRHIAADRVLGEVVPAFQKLVQRGKTRFFGITALGETPALHRVIDAKVLHTAQVSYNLLNPSPGAALPPGVPAQDYGRLLDHTRNVEMGVIGIRALAGGALSGTEARHPLNTPTVEPIGTAPSYAADVRHTRALEPLVREGHADSLIEASLRFIIAHHAVSTVLVGLATLEQLEFAIAAVEKGPFGRAALDRLAELQRGLKAD